MTKLIRICCRSLFGQIVLATLLGILLGCAAPETAIAFKPLSDGFIKLISMIVAPLIFCVVVQGIASVDNLRSVERIGLKALVYFEVMTSVALIFGLFAAWLPGPGRGLHINLDALTGADMRLYSGRAESLIQGGITPFLLGIIPLSPVAAFAANHMIEILFFAVIFGVALSLIWKEGRPVSRLIDALTKIFFQIMRLIVRVAPLGVFGAIAYTVGHYDLHVLGRLVALVMAYFVTVILLLILCLGTVLRLCGLHLFPLIRYFREELLIVMATASSDAVLPQVMQKLEALGIRRDVVGLVIPAGYSLNLDALSIYIGMAVLFLAQVTGTSLGVGQLALIIFTALITSKGAHGVPGTAIVILAATLAAVPIIPTIGLVLILSVDWYLGICRAMGNVIGNCVATIVIASWEGEFGRPHPAAPPDLRKINLSKGLIFSYPRLCL